MITNFNDVKMDQKIYLIVSSAFYIFSFYQNILICYRFYQNMTKMHDYLFKIKTYIHQSEKEMEHFLSFSSTLKSKILFIF